MARRIFPSTSRKIFTQKPSWSSRILSGFLLSLSLGVTVAGIATAIYLERPHDAALPPAPLVGTSQNGGGSAPASTPVPIAMEPASKAQGPEITLDPPAVAASPEARSTEEPGIGTTTPQASVAPAPRDTAMLEPQAEEIPVPPPAEPAAVSAEPARQYWVEYAVFAGPRHARRLQAALAAHGLAAVVVRTHGPTGRKLIRVRSSRMADYGQARAAAEDAEQRLRLTALIHRSSSASTNLAARPPARSTRNLQFWVQFGAFAHRPQAARLSGTLALQGIETVVTGLRAPSGRPVFVVRSPPLPDRQSAAVLAMRGQQAGNPDFLIGEKPEAAPDRPSKPRSSAVSQAG